ncbi:MAG: PatB family C-S lyase [Bacteroidales bacterium]|nr:PatB family C-S lyase [Bacteroidales bacterium]
MKYNFDEVIPRQNTGSLKYDINLQIFGSDDLLPMWVADMDFKTPDFVVNALTKRLEHPILGYFYHTDGFYQSIVNWMWKRHQWKIEKEWITFAPGIVSGLAFLIQTFTNNGDKIIVQPPVYHPFFAVIEKQGRQIVRNPLMLIEGSYQINFSDLEEKLREGAKMMIISNPHNPVGRCWKLAELKEMAELCLKYNCLLISDEIHSDLIMRGFKHLPVANISPEIAHHTITCMAPSKTFNIAGLATSEIIISNPELRQQFQQKMNDAVHILGNVFGDIALETAYTYGEDWLEQLIDYLMDNVKYCQEFIQSNLPKLRTFDHEATYLLWVDFRNLGLSHEELCHILVHKAKLGFNDGLIFGEEGRNFMRINLAYPRSVIKESMNRLQNALK